MNEPDPAQRLNDAFYRAVEGITDPTLTSNATPAPDPSKKSGRAPTPLPPDWPQRSIKALLANLGCSCLGLGLGAFILMVSIALHLHL